MGITTSSILSAPVQQSFSYKLLAVPVPYMVHNLAATKKYMPKNGGRFLRMRRYNPLLTATVPLGNSGIESPPQSLTAVDLDAQVNFYGTYIILNEQVDFVACYKPDLIDLEAYGKSYGDRAQAEQYALAA